MDVLSCILTNRIPPTKVMMSESGLPRENSDTVLSRVYGVCLRIMMPWTGGRSICGRLSCSRFQRLLQLLTYLSDAVSCAIFSAVYYQEQIVGIPKQEKEEIGELPKLHKIHWHFRKLFTGRLQHVTINLSLSQPIVHMLKPQLWRHVTCRDNLNARGAINRLSTSFLTSIFPPPNTHISGISEHLNSDTTTHTS